MSSWLTRPVPRPRLAFLLGIGGLMSMFAAQSIWAIPPRTIREGDFEGSPLRTTAGRGSYRIVCDDDTQHKLWCCIHNTNLSFWECESLYIGGDGPSVTVDGSDIAHVAFYDMPGGRLMHAFQDGNGGWLYEVAASGGRVGRHASIATDPGHVYASYYDSTNGDLKFATRSPGGVWSTELVDTAGNVGEFTSLIAHSPNFAVSYYDAGLGDLKVARRIGGIWSTEIVDSAGNVGEFSSLTRLALGVADSTEIAYYDRTHQNLRIARRIGSWSKYTIETLGDVGVGASIMTTGPAITDSAFISYSDVTDRTVRAYVHEKFEPPPPVGVIDLRAPAQTWVKCSIDPQGAIRIRYRVPEAGRYRISIYDVQGRLVARPMRRTVERGEHEEVWRGEGLRGRVESGIYLIEVSGAGVSGVGHVPLLR